ncbi:MAG: 30S ribosomal protein S4 [Candidatus Ryanbacteria bacterium]|nr:30S ribosomal protein S4 [Candidatus Ryanbacteria bacterium]
MTDAKCKICRRQGEKLFLKGERCYSQKCAIVRKPYPPGVHGRARRRRAESEFAIQLREKQKVRFLYGVSENQFQKYVESALGSHGGDVIEKVVRNLEMRLDNIVFRLGFALSRSIARQLISHGHIAVHGKRVFVPSYQARAGQKISIAEQSIAKGVFRNLDITLKKHAPPAWLSLNPEAKEGEVTSLPKVEDVIKSYNIRSIIEYYSR